MKDIIFHMSVYEDEVVICHKQIKKVVESVEDTDDYFNAKAKLLGVEKKDLIVMRSSSMDFPEDETENKETLKLVDEINVRNSIGHMQSMGMTGKKINEWVKEHYPELDVVSCREDNSK